MNNNVNKVNKKVDVPVSEVLTLSELDSFLHDIPTFSDFSIGCYSLKSKDEIDNIFINGISLRNTKASGFKDEVKYMGVVRNVPMSKVENYYSNILISNDGKTCVEINIVVLIPPFIHNYYSRIPGSNDYFLGHYPSDYEDFSYLNNVDLVYLLESRLGRIPKEYIVGYIEKVSDLVDKNKVQTKFVTNPYYYTNLSEHDKALVDYEFIKNVSLNKLLVIHMRPDVYKEVNRIVQIYKEHDKSREKISKFEEDYVNWNSVEKIANEQKSKLKIDKKLQDSYSKQCTLIRELKLKPQLGLREKQYLEYFNPEEKVLAKANQADIYKNLEGMTIEDYKRTH